LAKKKKTEAKSVGKPASTRPAEAGRSTKGRRRKKKISYDAKVFALAAAKIADQRHCSDIVILDLRGLSPATDYFVIATSTSDRQMRTVADEICQDAKKQQMTRFGIAGYEYAHWIVLDFIDVVVHIFDSEHRDYYDLELLWGDAKRIVY
jgi:ribosome-associated protein